MDWFIDWFYSAFKSTVGQIGFVFPMEVSKAILTQLAPIEYCYSLKVLLIFFFTSLRNLNQSLCKIYLK